MNVRNKLIKSMQTCSTYSFQSVMNDFHIQGTESYKILDFLVKEGIIEEKGECFVVVVDENRLCEFKAKFKDEEYNETDVNDDDLFENDENHLFDKENESHNHNDDSVENATVKSIRSLKRKNGFAPLPKGETLYLNVYGVTKNNINLKINIKDSIKVFFDNLLKQDSTSLKPFFETKIDFLIYTFYNKNLDFKNSTFDFGNYFMLGSLKFNRPIIKQRNAYNSIMEEYENGKVVNIHISLKCKEKYKRKIKSLLLKNKKD